MGHQSQKGQVGFKTQVSKGSFLDPGAASPNNGVFMRLRSGQLGVQRTLISPDPEIGGSRDIPAAYLGTVMFAGQYQFYPRMESLATLLTAGSGSNSDSVAGTGSTQIGTHTITPADTLPWLSVEESVSDLDCFQYTDAKVDKLHLEAAADGYLMGTSDLIALTGTGGHTRTAVPHWDVTPMIVGTNIGVTYGGVSVGAKSFAWDLNNNMENNDFRLGSLFLGGLVEKRREVTGNFVIRPEDLTYWKTAVYGSSAASAPQGGPASVAALVITLTSYEVIGTTVTVYSCSFTQPSTILEPFENVQNHDDVVQNTINFRAIRPDPTVPLYTAVLKNALATVL